jgi:hypothetical protein
LAHVSGPALTRHGAVTVGRERVDTSVGSEPAFIFPSPRAKRRATAIALGGIAVGTVGMLAIMGGSAFVIAGIALLCLVAIWSLIALRRRQLLALTPTRVVVEMPAGTVEVLWDAGVDAEIYPMPTGQATRRCVTSGTDRPSAAANMSWGRFSRRSRPHSVTRLCSGSRTPAAVASPTATPTPSAPVYHSGRSSHASPRRGRSARRPWRWVRARRRSRRPSCSSRASSARGGCAASPEGDERGGVMASYPGRGVRHPTRDSGALPRRGHLVRSGARDDADLIRMG